MNFFQSLNIAKNKKFGEVSLYNKRCFLNNENLKKILSKFPCQIMSRPLMIHIGTVNICNNNCIFCANESNKDNKKIMSVDLFSKIVSDYVNIGGGLISLTPSPGEIFLDPLLKRRLQLSEWIHSTFGQGIPFGYTLEYTTWGSLIGSKLIQLPGDARWKDMPCVTPRFRPLV